MAKAEETINDPDGVIDLLAKAQADSFWGTFSFGFQAGRLTMIRKEETFKVGKGFDLCKAGP